MSREPVRKLVHLGSGKEGRERKARLEEISDNNVSAMICAIADGRLIVTKDVQYQYWQHKRSGETFAVRIEAGEPTWVNGPLHHSDVEAHDPSEYHFDDRFEDDPEEYRLNNHGN